MAIAFSQKEQVQHATHIVDLIGETVALKARGREFVGLCPFHDDKNPSLNVSPSKQIYKCFSCGAGGDVFSYVMGYHKMTFPEAIKHLADRAGIELVQSAHNADDAGEKTDRQRIADANEKAISFYRGLLKHADHGRIAREYLAKRGINEEMTQAFAIGAAPDRWDGLAMTVAQKGWNTNDFESAGLIAMRSQGGGYYDRLRHRLIFPILDALNRPLAFGGRTLPSGELDDASDAKYLNSPETALFNKSSTLYGLHRAKKPIIDARTAVIVEGYTDVIACHQHGADNVVATLGTALTTEHVTALRRFADKVVLVFDADEAGQKAADRALELFLVGQVDVALVVLPDGQDPDELLAQPNGLAIWRELIEHAVDALDYQFERVRGQLASQTTMTGRQRTIEEYLRKLASLGLTKLSGDGAIRRAMVIQWISDLLNMSPQDVADQLKRLAPRRREHAVNTAPTPSEAPDNHVDDDFPEHNPASDVAPTLTASKMGALQSAERQLIGALLRDSTTFTQMLTDGRTLDEAVQPMQLFTPEAVSLYQLIYDRLSEHSSLTLAGLLGDLAEQGQTALANLATQAEAEVEMFEAGQPERTAELARQAAESLLRFTMENEYAQMRRRQNASTNDEQDDESAKLAALKKAVEHHRTNPSSMRIARIAGTH